MGSLAISEGLAGLAARWHGDSACLLPPPPCVSTCGGRGFGANRAPTSGQGLPLGRSLVVARTNYLVMLRRLASRAAGLGAFRQDLDDAVLQNVMTLMGEDVFLSLIEDGRSQGDIRQGVTLEVMGESSAGPLGHGLSNMRDRARNVGGNLNLVSSPGEGTTITVGLPGRRESAPAAPVMEMTVKKVVGRCRKKAGSWLMKLVR